MLPFKVVSAVMCDDVRLEINHKAILIGVYNGSLIVPGFPAELVGSWWLQIFPQEVGQFEIEVQVVKDELATLVRAIAGFQVPAIDWTALTLPKTPLHLQSPGHLKLQMKLKSDTDWTTIYEFDVKVGVVVGAVQQVMSQQAVA